MELTIRHCRYITSSISTMISVTTSGMMISHSSSISISRFGTVSHRLHPSTAVPMHQPLLFQMTHSVAIHGVAAGGLYLKSAEICSMMIPSRHLWFL